MLLAVTDRKEKSEILALSFFVTLPVSISSIRKLPIYSLPVSPFIQEMFFLLFSWKQRSNCIAKIPSLPFPGLPVCHWWRDGQEYCKCQCEQAEVWVFPHFLQISFQQTDEQNHFVQHCRCSSSDSFGGNDKWLQDMKQLFQQSPLSRIENNALLNVIVHEIFNDCHFLHKNVFNQQSTEKSMVLLQPE